MFVTYREPRRPPRRENYIKAIMGDHIGDNILIPQVDNVVLFDKSDGNNKSMDGTLCISGHHLILSSRQDDGQELWVGVNKL